MAIRLFDSLTREMKTLGDRGPNSPPVSTEHPFAFYNCGPTVYAPAHIGNFRTFVINDVIRRLLELEFGADKVKHVRNLTDVDDKTIKRSREEGRPLGDVTKQWTDKFHADCDALNCLRPHVEPAATTHIAEQIKMISSLEGSGNAYRAPDGSVYFKVSSFAGYGALSRVKERELKTTSAFAADADEKEDLSDFALWKAHKPEDGDVAWDSPWGRGRPGWHIECSAMIRKHLGDTIDLHTGGEDLLFPHHENEIAQSECCTGVKFSRHWYHSKHLLVDDKKMSKSLGNLYTLDDLVAKEGFTPTAVRYALLAGHPRKQLNFTLDSLRSTRSAIGKLLGKLAGFGVEFALKSPGKPSFEGWQSFAPVWEALCDDLNTPEALGVMFSTLDEIKPHKLEPARARLEGAAFERLLWIFFGWDESVDLRPEVPAEVRILAEKRWAAKKAKDFKVADALRAEITAAGWSMLDGKDLSKDDYKLEPLKKS